MRRDLEKDVVGRRIKTAEVKSSRNAMRVIRRHGKRKDFTSRLVGRKLTKVERRGKYVLLHLDSGDALVTHFGMSVSEALRAATLGSAQALRAPDRGAMVRGKYADIVAWDADHEGAFAWSYGLKPLRVWRGGEPARAEP